MNIVAVGNQIDKLVTYLVKLEVGLKSLYKIDFIKIHIPMWWTNDVALLLCVTPYFT